MIAPFRKVRIGTSVEARAIYAFVRSGDVCRVMIFAAFHGDEPKTVTVVRELLKAIEESAVTNIHKPRLGNDGFVIVPCVNPDGYQRRKRRNANKIDLNRNFPTSNWEVGSKRSRMYGGSNPASEPETRAVMRLIDRYEPAAVITVHSIGRDRYCNNFDGPGKRLANLLAKSNNYPVVPSIGYPTPGSFGTYAGVERQIPTVTLELPSHHSPKRCWENNRAGLLAAMGVTSTVRLRK